MYCGSIALPVILSVIRLPFRAQPKLLSAIGLEQYDLSILFLLIFFFFNFVFRIYWGFVGNRYANWKNFIPYTKCHWTEMWDIVKVDILQVECKDNPNLGHNALASFTYFLTFLAFLLQVLTGFGMYAAMSPFVVPTIICLGACTY